MSNGTHEDLGTRQWEAHVSQMVARGIPRQAILETMLRANWPDQAARALIQRVVSKARGVALAIMLGCALMAIVALIITIVSYQQARWGGTWFVWIGGVLTGATGFVYGLVRLIKASA